MKANRNINRGPRSSLVALDLSIARALSLPADFTVDVGKGASPAPRTARVPHASLREVSTRSKGR